MMSRPDAGSAGLGATICGPARAATSAVQAIQASAKGFRDGGPNP